MLREMSALPGVPLRGRQGGGVEGKERRDEGRKPKSNAATGASAASVRAVGTQFVTFYFRAPAKAFFRTRVEYVLHAIHLKTSLTTYQLHGTLRVRVRGLAFANLLFCVISSSYLCHSLPAGICQSYKPSCPGRPTLVLENLDSRPRYICCQTLWLGIHPKPYSASYAC